MHDGSKVSIQRTFVWCATCREVRWGEELADLVELERDFAATSSKNPAVLEELSFSVSRYQTLDELLASRTRELESRIAWRRIRTSPPRCLECGSMEITPLERSETRSGNEKWTLREHTSCGGMIVVLEQMVLALDRRWFLYTLEGERRQTYEMYPHKGAVPIDGI